MVYNGIKTRSGGHLRQLVEEDGIVLPINVTISISRDDDGYYVVLDDINLELEGYLSSDDIAELLIDLAVERFDGGN